MKHKLSKELAVFGVAQIIFGIAGSILFLMSLDLVSLSSFYIFKTPIEEVFTIGIDFKKLAIGALYCLMTFPFVLIFLCGIGILCLRRWARKVSLIGLPVLLSSIYIFAYGIYFSIRGAMNWRSFSMTIQPLTIFVLFSMWFLTRPKIKRQFN